MNIQMKIFKSNAKSAVIVASFFIVSVGAFAAGKKTSSDDWSWKWMGTVEDSDNMYPNTNVAKFKDMSNGVVCYVYSSKNAASITYMANGVTKKGVDGSQIGTMSCVSERR